MTGLIDELKYNFKKQNNGLVQLILINVIVFVFMGILYVFSHILPIAPAYVFLEKQITLPAPISEFLHRPWTLFTYFFAHASGINGVFHILFNMLGLYWFGKIIHNYVGNRRLINLYILGGLIGGLLFLLLSNTVPFFIQKSWTVIQSGDGFITLPTSLVGASGSVYAVAVAAATLVPHHTFYLFFFGSVRIVYIVAIFMFISFLSTVGGNAGGEICHMGGALLGYIYITQLRKGRDLGQPINFIAKWINKLLRRKSNLKISYRSKEGEEITQKEIDAILDKINRSGYNSLTKDEKQKLYKASQK